MKRSSGPRRALSTALLCLLPGLVACTTDHPVDLNRAGLMPESAAKQIIARWVPQYTGGDSLDIEDGVVPIKSIQRLTYLDSRKLQVFRPSFWVQVGVICAISLDDAKQFGAALTALGASVTLTEAPPLYGAGASCGGVRGAR